MTDRVSIEVVDGIANVRLARPEKINALDHPMFEAIAAAITRIGDDPRIRCVVLSGLGRGFCVGLTSTALRPIRL